MNKLVDRLERKLAQAQVKQADTLYNLELLYKFHQTLEAYVANNYILSKKKTYDFINKLKANSLSDNELNGINSLFAESFQNIENCSKILNTKIV
jgi:hypothetical protein